MAPLQSKKRKSVDSQASNSNSTAGPSLPEGSSITPSGSPARKKVKITLSQKQALIDNLQLEITDRARRLRATYAHQALSLRSRIETRVNRIPRSLRKATMGELLAKYSETLKRQQEPDNNTTAAMNVISSHAKSRPLPAIPQVSSTDPPSAARSPAEARGLKRASDDLVLPDLVSDKENAPHELEACLPNPKKRSKPAAGAGRTASQTRPRAASRTTKATTAASALQAQTAKVLSPRSPNSRTLQMSPSKTSPIKSLIARPVSPLKPASPLKVTTLMVGGAVAASLAGMVEHAKSAKEKARKISPRGLAEARKEKKAAAAAAAAPAPSTTTRGTRKAAHTTQADDITRRTVSSSSHSSTSTTVVTKQTVARKPTAKKTVVTESQTATAKKGAAAAAAAAKAAVGANKKGKEAVEVPAAGRRVLRKRA